MFDSKKIDSFFQSDTSDKHRKIKRAQIIRWLKLGLPCVAAVLLSLLFIIPQIKKEINELAIDITRPKSGEIEKLHVENTTLYITDDENKIHNFTAENIDETEPGSKLVKLIHPEGIIPIDDKTWVNIKSPTGYYDQNQNTMTLTDNVDVFYSDGMELNIPDFTYNFKEYRGYSDKPLTANGLMGDIKSEGLEFFSKTGILIFKGKTNITIHEEGFKK